MGDQAHEQLKSPWWHLQEAERLLERCGDIMSPTMASLLVARARAHGRLAREIATVRAIENVAPDSVPVGQSGDGCAYAASNSTSPAGGGQ